jgi:hypothetical protein
VALIKKITEHADICVCFSGAYLSADQRWKGVERIKSRKSFLMQMYRKERIYKIIYT